jgi:L-ascorbate metabolism protein UlaG (beta-lactamase superfamily)
MLRFFSAIAATVIVVPFAWSQGVEQPAKPTLSWYGQSFFILKTANGTQIAFDPHAIEEYGRLQGLRADIILMSHKHPDHVQKGVFENPSPEIIVGWKPGASGQETWNIIDQRLRRKAVRIYSVGVWHDDIQGMKRGINTVFIVETDGWRICHLGDLGHKLSAAQLKAIGEVDVLMIPAGGIYSLNGSEAKDVLQQIKPKHFVFAMHIGTRVYDDLLPIDEFVDENPYPVAVVRDEVLIVNPKARENISWLRKESPKSDNTIVLDRTDKGPRPVIVGLHYWPQAEKKKMK